MIKKNQIARDVRITLNNDFKEKCLGDKYLKQEPELYIRDEHIYNDTLGDYVHIDSEHVPSFGDIQTGVNVGYAYLNEIDLKYPVKRP